MAAVKIVTTCKIKDVKVTSKGAVVNFKELKISDGHLELLSGMIQDNELLEITLKPTQQKMEFEDNKKKAAGDSDD